MTTADLLCQAAKHLSAKLASQAKEGLYLQGPVTHVYDPLGYAWQAHEQYLRRFGSQPKRVVFLGMNPGPFGMMQTGIPFGEIASVRDWMGIQEPINKPAQEHPKRLIEGFECKRSEVSGKRLWTWAGERFGSAEQFFAKCFVLNYCPLVFLEAGGKNFTPDKLPAASIKQLHQACDDHLRASLAALQPEWAIGVGAYAMKRISQACSTDSRFENLKIGQILHPSPASPVANRGWASAVDAQLQALVPDLY